MSARISSATVAMGALHPRHGGCSYGDWRSARIKRTPPSPCCWPRETDRELCHFRRRFWEGDAKPRRGTRQHHGVGSEPERFPEVCCRPRYRRRFEQLKAQRELFGDRPGEWSDWLDRMDATLLLARWEGDWAGLARAKLRRKHPTKTIPEWPTPYFLTHRQGRRRGLPPVPRATCSTKRESRKTVRRGVSPVVFAPLLPSSSEERCRTTGGLRPPSRGSR